MRAIKKVPRRLIKVIKLSNVSESDNSDNTESNFWQITFQLNGKQIFIGKNTILQKNDTKLYNRLY